MTCGARRCSGSLAGAAVELRPEESRRALEDLVGPPELLVLPFELAHPDPFLGRETGASAPVDLGLLDPVAEGLGADPELAGDAGDDALVVAVPLDGLLDHPDRAFLDLSWIATRAWVSVGVGHGLHLPSKRWSLHQSQCGSKGRAVSDRVTGEDDHWLVLRGCRHRRYRPGADLLDFHRAVGHGLLEDEIGRRRDGTF